MNRAHACLLLIAFASSPHDSIGEEKVKLQQDAGLKATTYARSSNSIRFKWPTHIAFGRGNQEIVSDLKNNRLLFRKGPNAPFQVSPVPVRGLHSLVYNPADRLYYVNDTGNHRIIAFASLSSKEITSQTKKIAGVRLNRPHDIVLDAKSNWLYAINPNSGHVFRFTAIGKNESALKVPVQGYARALTLVNGTLYVIGSAKGRIVEVVNWETQKFKIYDSFDPTKRSGPAGSWARTGLVLNDLEFFDGYWYATSYFTKSYAKGTDPEENKFIRFAKLENLVSGKWTDLSRLVPKGMTPYYLTAHEKKLYLAIFNHEAPGKGDSIIQFVPHKTASSPAAN
jgi:hypothetical protein